jgi:hypothetical protein
VWWWWGGGQGRHRCAHPQVLPHCTRPVRPCPRQLRTKASVVDVEDLAREVRAKAPAAAVEDLGRALRGKADLEEVREALGETATKQAVVAALHRKANKDSVVRGKACACACARCGRGGGGGRGCCTGCWHRQLVGHGG